MRRNIYAVILLVVLAAVLAAAGRHIDTTAERMDTALCSALTAAQSGQTERTAALYRALLADWRRESPVLALFTRRNLTDAIGQTLAALPYYARTEQLGDLAADTARAREQLRAWQQSFFSGL